MVSLPSAFSSRRPSAASPSPQSSGSPSQPSPERPTDEQAIRAKLVAVAVVALIVSAVLLAFISALGELFVDPQFRVSETLIGMFIAASLALLGVASWDRLGRK